MSLPPSPSLSPVLPPSLPPPLPLLFCCTSITLHSEIVGCLAKCCIYLPPSPYTGSVASGHLAECLRQFIATLVLPGAGNIGGPLYHSPEHSAAAGQYWDQCWTIYQKLSRQTWCGRQSENTVTMRQVLLLLEVCMEKLASFPDLSTVQFLITCKNGGGRPWLCA